MRRRVMLIAIAALAAAAPAFAAARMAHPARRHVAAPPAPAQPAHAGSAARTLDDIHIEGEIPVPQVLFITDRDQRRFLEFQHRRYLRSSRQLGEATAPPGWIVVTHEPIHPTQETPR